MKKSMLMNRREARMALRVGAALVLVAAAQLMQGAPAAELLEKGIYLEETRGELPGAIEVYRQIVEDTSAERSLAAQAQLRLGLCELKQGNKPHAVSALERLTQQFPDKDQLLALIGDHMPLFLDEMMKQIEQNYIQEIDRSELVETAIRAVIGKLDSRSGFLRPDDMQFLGAQEMTQINENLEQKVAGIGAELKADESTHEIVVVTPLPESPALKGGLLAGDRIASINGDILTEETRIGTAVKLLRGPVGTAVTVGVRRSGSTEALQIQLVRDTVRLASVQGDRRKADHSWEFMLDERMKVGYIRLTQLSKQSPEEMRTALVGLQARGMRALIFDLRNNPGGLFAEAVAVSDLFVSSGRIVTVKGRNGEEVYDAQARGTFADFPVVAMVDRGTASAAEIIAACLQDHGRATIVGERTFGQGIVRSIVQLKGGIGALKLPVAAYYRPNGNNVNRYPNFTEADDWGVRPNDGFEVRLTDAEREQSEKYRHEQSILSNAPRSGDDFRDRQLQRAIESVNALLGE
jgi:carboxyl-terminal processing protease